ncbi:MAG TPA: NUDIX hydrolase, partial [Candidatus Nitrosocosmicus sp.]|nr:NUDIX hydrolase [Candidatus Nitrosocosmicus sp.]
MKIPDHAKQVFKGIIFDVYQWEQEMFDGSTHTFEGLKRPNTVLVIPTVENKIIITKQEQPDKPQYYSLLGGRQDGDEEPLQTAKRELMEEAGMASNDWELYKVYDNFSKFDWQLYLYIARNCEKTADQKLDPGEKIELVGLSFEDFIELHTSEDFWGGEITVDILKMRLNP